MNPFYFRLFSAAVVFLILGATGPAMAQPGNTTPGDDRLITICHFPPGNPDNSRTISVTEDALPALLAQGARLGACEDDAPVIPSFAVDAQTDRSYGTTDTVFQFRAVVLPEDAVEITGFSWQIDDGRTFSQPEIALSFDEPGFHSISLTAISVSGDVDTAEIGVVVHEAGQFVPEGLPIPQPFGDVDGDGRTTLVDVHRAAKFVGRLSALPDDRARLAADLDRSGRVTFDDVRLIAEALLSKQPLPDRLLSTSGPPGSAVTLVSHHLLDANDFIEISIGDEDQRQTVNRPVLGFVTFIMPFTGAAARTGEQEIRLLVNGNEATSFAFTVTEPAPVPEDPIAELDTFLDEIQQLLERNEALLIEQLDTLALSKKSRETLLAIAAGSRLEMAEIADDLRALLSTPEGEVIAEVFFKAANANGLSEVRARLQAFLQADSTGATAFFSTAAISPGAVCDQLLPALCALQSAADLVDTVSDVISITCDITLAAGLGGVITGVGTTPSAVALIAWAKVCAPAEFTLDVAGILTDLISDIDQDLRTEVDNSAPEPGEAATITAKLEVFGLDDICQLGGSAGTDKLIDKLAERVVNRMLRRKVTLRAVERVFTFLGEEMLQEFFGLLQEGAKRAIKATGLDQAILDFATPYCDDLFGADLIMDASRILTGPQPDVGTLTFQSDGTARYVCPDEADSVPESGVEFKIEKQICDSLESRTEIIQCSPLRDITITMGDNGALNDDIFEVLLEGETVLTSNVPVRSISTTVQLPAGSTAEVQMLGRAAPDGIGTYFITFSGATVIAGDATSGTDLVPGVVKNFTIQVQQ